ncbi:hypothetical protein LSAT2_008537 [Lamellibrachia satsuma]|nr:hypothetical protein LSAT2_008537 [Lamellibrachia satsuma]
MSGRVASLSPSVVANVTAAAAETFSTVSAVTVTGTATSTESTTPFIWVPYVVLAVIIVALFCASFARYHVLHRNMRTTRTHAPRLHGSLVSNLDVSRTSLSSGCAMPSTCQDRLPMYSKSIDVKKVLASIYQEDRRNLLSPVGKMQTQRAGRTTCSRRGNVHTSVSSNATEVFDLYPPVPTIKCLPLGNSFSPRVLPCPPRSASSPLSSSPKSSAHYRSIDFIFDAAKLDQRQPSCSLSELKARVDQCSQPRL